MENLTAVMKQDLVESLMSPSYPFSTGCADHYCCLPFSSTREWWKSLWDSRSGKQLLSLFHAESILLAAF